MPHPCVPTHGNRVVPDSHHYHPRVPTVVFPSGARLRGAFVELDSSKGPAADDPTRFIADRIIDYQHIVASCELFSNECRNHVIHFRLRGRERVFKPIHVLEDLELADFLDEFSLASAAYNARRLDHLSFTRRLYPSDRVRSHVNY